MNYSLRKLDAFLVIGQVVELTQSKRKNITISTQFWRIFNTNLKKSHLSQSGNWQKYAFMERRMGKLYYYCAIPFKTEIPDGFYLKEVKPHLYLVVEHHGAMMNIYETYDQIYRHLLPNIHYEPLKEDCIHFERYDHRFHWNREDSIIEIWVPIRHTEASYKNSDV